MIVWQRRSLFQLTLHDWLNRQSDFVSRRFRAPQRARGPRGALPSTSAPGSGKFLHMSPAFAVHSFSFASNPCAFRASDPPNIDPDDRSRLWRSAVSCWRYSDVCRRFAVDRLPTCTGKEVADALIVATGRRSMRVDCDCPRLKVVGLLGVGLETSTPLVFVSWHRGTSATAPMGVGCGITFLRWRMDAAARGLQLIG